MKYIKLFESFIEESDLDESEVKLEGYEKEEIDMNMSIMLNKNYIKSFLDKAKKENITFEEAFKKEFPLEFWEDSVDKERTNIAQKYAMDKLKATADTFDFLEKYEKIFPQYESK